MDRRAKGSTCRGEAGSRKSGANALLGGKGAARPDALAIARFHMPALGNCGVTATHACLCVHQPVESATTPEQQTGEGHNARDGGLTRSSASSLWMLAASRAAAFSASAVTCGSTTGAGCSILHPPNVADKLSETANFRWMV